MCSAKGYCRFACSGFPHSEIPGSTRVCRSPRLIAAYHVLHRSTTPRHPPCALSSLIKGKKKRLSLTLLLLLSIFGCQRTEAGLVANFGGDSRVRTGDLRLAKPALSQLSYIPCERPTLVGLGRFELPTSRLSGVRSNQLSYRPNIPAAGPRSSLWQENSVRGPPNSDLPSGASAGPTSLAPLERR